MIYISIFLVVIVLELVWISEQLKGIQQDIRGTKDWKSTKIKNDETT